MLEEQLAAAKRDAKSEGLDHLATHGQLADLEHRLRLATEVIDAARTYLHEDDLRSVAATEYALIEAIVRWDAGGAGDGGDKP